MTHSQSWELVGEGPCFWQGSRQGPAPNSSSLLLSYEAYALAVLWAFWGKEKTWS